MDFEFSEGDRALRSEAIDFTRANWKKDVYDTAKAHCETFGKASSLAESIAFGVHSFSCG